ncbi:janus kinase and microtubule-interacting protein 2-like, partial [Anneissia japonica]|uniref:janus kinase and microtubule-interacting protein 2-like n=1 Tax=Anneissia japonica TaxID=1529436 RepID=UPI001425686E
MATKSPDRVSSLEAHNHTLKTNLEEMRAHVGQLKQELDQKQSTVKQLRREKVLEIKQLQQENEKHCNTLISDLKSKLLSEKKRELFNLKEQLTKLHNTEINRISHTKDEALKRFKIAAQKEKEDFFLRKKHELLVEAKEGATRVFEGEKTKLLQEVDELKRSKKQLEEELSVTVNADKQKAMDLRRSHEEHLRVLEQIRKEAKTDIRRLIEELKSKDRVIGDLEKELGHQSSYSQRLLLEKDSLGNLLNLTKMAESWEKRSPRALSAMKKSYSLDLGNLADNEDSDKERRLQLRLSDLSNTVRRLEDRNRQLMDEKTDIEKKMASSPTGFASSSQAEKTSK